MKKRYRVVATRIWKDRKFRSLDPLEKELYLYLLTNDQTAMCGIYQTTLDEIAHDTGIDYRQIPAMLEKFEALGIGGMFNEEWVVIPNYMKHQNMDNPKVRAGVEADLLSIPVDVIDYAKGIHSLSKGIDTTRATTTPTTTTTPPKKEGALPPALKDELANHIDRSMREVQPYENFARERGQIKNLVARCRRRNPDDPFQVADAMMAGFRWLRENGDKFWKRQPFTPSALSSLWERVEAEMSREVSEKRRGQEQAQSMVEWLNG